MLDYLEENLDFVLFIHLKSPVHLVTEIGSEKCIVRWFCPCANIIEYIHTNLEVSYTNTLYCVYVCGTACFSEVHDEQNTMPSQTRDKMLQ